MPRAAKLLLSARHPEQPLDRQSCEHHTSLIIWETKMHFSFQSSQGFLVNESDFHEGQGVTGQGALADSNACFSHLEDGAL